MFRIPIGRLTGDSEKLSRQTDGTVGGFSVFFNGFEDLGGAKFSEGAKFSFPPPPLFVVPRGDVNRKQNFAHPNLESGFVLSVDHSRKNCSLGSLAIVKIENHDTRLVNAKCK